MDRFAAMTAFVAVVDLRGFAPAARHLGVSASAVTRMVAALEQRLATRLLQRTTRSLALTDAGTRYLARARRILGDLDEAEGAALAEHSAPTGRLVVSAPALFGRLHVAPLLSAYLARYPRAPRRTQPLRPRRQPRRRRHRHRRPHRRARRLHPRRPQAR